MNRRTLHTVDAILVAILTRALPASLVMGLTVGAATYATRHAHADVLMAWHHRVAASDVAHAAALVGLLTAFTVGHLTTGLLARRPARVARRDVPARAVVGVRLAGRGVAPAARGAGAAPGSDAHFPRRRTPQVIPGGAA